MDRYYLSARSVTYAQKMAKVLEQNGIHPKIRRVSATMSGRGCGYTLEIAAYQYERALALLKAAGWNPTRVFVSADSRLREVGV